MNAVSPEFEVVSELTVLQRRWGIYNYDTLKQRCNQTGKGEYLIESLIAAKSLNIIVGDSGLGKSPLLYQIGVCIAAGVDFLGRRVKQGRVLILDFENGLGQVEEIVSTVSKYLGVTAPPDDLLLWNFNDCPSNFGESGNTAFDLVRDTKPSLVIIDSFTSLYPDIEDKNSLATTEYKKFREVIRASGCTILGSHHLRKPSAQAGNAPPSLEDGSVRAWFLQARGARALINGSDTRLGVDEPSHRHSGSQHEIALVMRGFTRVSGEIPLTYISRIRDDDGEPLGYDRLTGPKLLLNVEQEKAYQTLPLSFRFKDAQLVYAKGAQATTDFLKKCVSLGLLRKDGRTYEKV